jgi:Cu/Ag efflux pump CusA
MIGRLIALSARNILLVLLGSLFLVGAGIYTVLHTPLDAIPDLSDTQVSSTPIIPVKRRRWSRTRSHIR